MNQKPETSLLFVYDALCGWTYAFIPVLERLMLEQPNATIALLSASWVPAHSEDVWGNHEQYIRATFAAATEQTGCRSGVSLHRGIDGNKIPPQNSEYAAKALLVMEKQYPLFVLSFLKDLQKAFFENGQDISSREGLQRVVRTYPVDEQAFLDATFSEETQACWIQNKLRINQLGVTSFPVLLMEDEGEKIHLICKGYAGFDKTQTLLSEHIAQRITKPAKSPF